MRDNEAILLILEECGKFLRGKMVEAIAADAKIETITAFTEAIRTLEHSSYVLGEPLGHHVAFGHAIAEPRVIANSELRTAAVEALAPVEKQLHTLIESIENVLATMAEPGQSSRQPDPHSPNHLARRAEPIQEEDESAG